MRFDPFKVSIFRDFGTANIAARINKPSGLVLVAVRCKFSAGAGDADMTIASYDAMTNQSLSVLHTIPDCGTGGEANVNVPFAREEVELGAWTVLPGEILQINWTNPASGTMAWALEVRYQLPSGLIV